MSKKNTQKKALKSNAKPKTTPKKSSAVIAPKLTSAPVRKPSNIAKTISVNRAALCQNNGLLCLAIVQDGKLSCSTAIKNLDVKRSLVTTVSGATYHLDGLPKFGEMVNILEEKHTLQRKLSAAATQLREQGKEILQLRAAVKGKPNPKTPATSTVKHSQPSSLHELLS